MKYSQRKEQEDTFDGHALRQIMRGSVKRIAAAAIPFQESDWRLKKEQHYSTVAKAIAGEVSWLVTCATLGDLEVDTYEKPEKYCYPPEIPETIHEFRKVALEYAPNTWWYGALKLGDVIKESSFQSAMSRGNPKSWPEIHRRAVQWRQACMDGLQRHNRRRLHPDNAALMYDTWLKDFIDANSNEIKKDRQVLLNEALRIHKLKQRHFERVGFNPAEPIGEAYMFNAVDDWEEADIVENANRELENSIALDFPNYREAEPPHGQSYHQTVKLQDYFMNPGGHKEWLQTYEKLRHNFWDAETRSYREESSKITRLLVRRPVGYAVEGERIGSFPKEIFLDHIKEKQPEGYEARDWRWNRVDGNEAVIASGIQHFVSRWRPADINDQLTDRAWILLNKGNPDDLTEMPQMPQLVEQQVEWDDVVEPDEYTLD